MNLKTVIAIALAGAFAVPLAAQASAEADRMILAQQSGKTDSSAGATDAKGGFAGIDRNNDGYLSRDEAKDATWSNRFTELDKDNDNRLSRTEFEAMQAGTGASGTTGAPMTSGSNAPDRKPSTPKQ